MSTRDAFYRRRLPHVRVAGAVYFVTWRLHPKQAELSPAERDIVASALNHFHGARYTLWAYVVMHDHVHVIVQPTPEYPLQVVVQNWKSYTAHRLAAGRKEGASFWQDEYLDRVIRDDAELEQKAAYIAGNPFKRWPELESYRWSWSISDQ